MDTGLSPINPNKDAILGRQHLGHIQFDKVNSRAYHGSIYMKEHSPDYYDNTKIVNAYKKTSQYQETKTVLEMSK